MSGSGPSPSHAIDFHRGAVNFTKADHSQTSELSRSSRSGPKLNMSPPPLSAAKIRRAKQAASIHAGPKKWQTRRMIYFALPFSAPGRRRQ
jgi:hypothetical protein